MTTKIRRARRMYTGLLSNPDTLVPDKRFYNEYISRTINGVSEFDIFTHAHENRMNVLIEGPTGPGKTSAVLAYAARGRSEDKGEGMPFYSIQCNGGAEPSQIFGRMKQDERGLWHFTDGGLTALVRLSHRRPCVLLLNELNFMPQKLGPVLFALLDKRRTFSLVDNEGEVLTAGDLLIVADYNSGDYAGTRQINEALVNRFPFKLFFDYDPIIESKLVKSYHLRDIAKKLRDEQRSGTHTTPVSTNALQEFEKIVESFGLDFAIQNFVNTFPVDYREAVYNVFKLHHSKLESDYALPIDDSIDLPDFEKMTSEEIASFLDSHNEVDEAVVEYCRSLGTTMTAVMESPDLDLGDLIKKAINHITNKKTEEPDLAGDEHPWVSGQWSGTDTNSNYNYIQVSDFLKS